MKSKFLKLLIEGKPSPEHRAAISKAAENRKPVEDSTREKMSSSHLGLKYAKETNKRRPYKKLMENFSIHIKNSSTFFKINQKLKNWK